MEMCCRIVAGEFAEKVNRVSDEAHRCPLRFPFPLHIGPAPQRRASVRGLGSKVTPSESVNRGASPGITGPALRTPALRE
jgi:hypothetical protein